MNWFTKTSFFSVWKPSLWSESSLTSLSTTSHALREEPTKDCFQIVFIVPFVPLTKRIVLSIKKSFASNHWLCANLRAQDLLCDSQTPFSSQINVHWLSITAIWSRVSKSSQSSLQTLDWSEMTPIIERHFSYEKTVYWIGIENSMLLSLSMITFFVCLHWHSLDSKWHLNNTFDYSSMRCTQVTILT